MEAQRLGTLSADELALAVAPREGDVWSRSPIMPTLPDDDA